ncbi:hypothetical protein [Cohnella silvisoli]|uniref:RNA polymerase alpha subunit C-terminal domain-containing protein n=1 Tax=Cohnella silvisoli TaxID=2873699 RepID=A0ABV1L3C2_9BACL|nr:hypothetical protein [Cohnella silvisoli]MCD9026064.1 hypothetical protein [Cohnella silvisoli]
MAHSLDSKPTLQSIYQFPSEFLQLDASCLKSVALELDYKPNPTRVMNLLSRCKCSTLGDVMALNWDSLSDIKGLGPGGESMLLDLLDRITEDPEAFRNRYSTEISIATLPIKYWLKINFKARRFTLHKDSCTKASLATSRVRFKSGIEHDYVFDGCWIGFPSIEIAVDFHSKYHKREEFTLCRVCFNKEVRDLFKHRGHNESPQYPLN